MADITLGSVLISSLASTLLDKDIIKSGVDIMLYNAKSFLQMRRQKMTGSSPLPTQPGMSPTPDGMANKPGSGGLNQENTALPDPPLIPGLDEFQLEYAEREIESLLTQLKTHHELLTIKQEQIAKFGEFAPPYMTLAVKSEQRAIVEKLVQMQKVVKQLYGVEHPEIQRLWEAIQ